MLLFLIMGGLVLASIDQIPYALIDNAIIMGLLSFLVAFIFLIDLSDPLAMRRISTTQTADQTTHEIGTQSEVDGPPGKSQRNGGAIVKNMIQHQQTYLGQPKDKDGQLPVTPERRIPPNLPPPKQQVVVHHSGNHTPQRPVRGLSPSDGDYSQGGQQTSDNHHHHHRNHHSPVRSQSPQDESEGTVQGPVFSHLLTPEKMRAQKGKVNTKGAFIVDEIPKSRAGSRYSDANQGYSEDETMSRIPEQSYVKTLEVDRIPRAVSSPSCRTRTGETNRDCEEINSPITPGYVVHAAKMWDSRAKPIQSAKYPNTPV